MTLRGKRFALGRINNTTFSRLRSRCSLRNASSGRSPPNPPPPHDALPSRRSTTDVMTRIEARTPQFLRPLLRPLYAAPISHITSFLVLHEITAVVPLFAIAAGFHYGGWMPENVADWKYVREGKERWERYARRKGWVQDEVSAVDREGGTVETEVFVTDETKEQGVRIVLELAAAWAITKVLLPVRLGLCVWATPWFAGRVMLPAMAAARRVIGR